MVTLIIIAVIWLVGIFVTYKCFASKWDTQSKGEQIYFSIIWPLLIPLYVIHLFYHKG